MSVALLTLGGTIAMAGTGGGVVARLTGADLTAAVPGLGELDLTVRDLRAVPSADLSLADLLAVLDAARQAVAGGATGVVVSQGTDTVEETAYLLDLLWTETAPLVFTGAMRNPTLAGPDGPANLLAACRVAADPAACGLGVLVVFNDQVHAARWVRKTHSTSTATFASPDTGPLGHLVEGVPRLLCTPARTAALTGPPPDPRRWAAARVALYTCTLDDDGALLAAVRTGHRGLVVAGFGVGHVPGRLAEPLGELASQLPVVLTSRTGAGPVLTGTYGAPGSETDLMRRGLISGGLLHPYRARLLLRLLLAVDADLARIRAEFAARGL